MILYLINALIHRLKTYFKITNYDRAKYNEEDMLVRWRIHRDRMDFALPDLRDFLSEERVRHFHKGLNETDAKRYEIAHEVVIRFLLDDPQLSLEVRKVHRMIARCALTHSGKWKQADMDDDADLYDLRFVLVHLHATGMDSEKAALMKDETYAAACGNIGCLFNIKMRYHIA